MLIFYSFKSATWTDYKTNTQIAKKLKITTILDKLLEYKRNWIQHVNRMPHNRLPRVMKHYSPTGRRNHGRPLKRLLDTWDQQRVNKWPNSKTDIWWWLWWWWCQPHNATCQWNTHIKQNFLTTYTKCQCRTLQNTLVSKWPEIVFCH